MVSESERPGMFAPKPSRTRNYIRGPGLPRVGDRIERPSGGMEGHRPIVIEARPRLPRAEENPSASSEVAEASPAQRKGKLLKKVVEYFSKKEEDLQHVSFSSDQDAHESPKDKPPEDSYEANFDVETSKHLLTIEVPRAPLRVVNGRPASVEEQSIGIPDLVIPPARAENPLRHIHQKSWVMANSRPYRKQDQEKSPLPPLDLYKPLPLPPPNAKKFRSERAAERK